MIIGQTEQEVEAWKEDLYRYQKGKRTKRPFGKQLPSVEKVTKKDVFSKEAKFNPILQYFRDQTEEEKCHQREQIEKTKKQMKYLQNNYKYNEEYDIVNFHPTTCLPIQNRSQTISYQNRKKQIKDPLPDIHDIINGRQYSSNILEKKQLRLPKRYERKFFKDNRDYNILSGKYNQNDQEKTNSQIKEINAKILDKYSKSKIYDPINPELSNSMEMSQSERFGKNYTCRFPVSYRERQPYIQDQTAPLPSILKELDQKAANAKQRYQLRYRMEDDHQQRGRYLSEKKEIDAINRVNNAKISLQRSIEFDYLNSQREHPKNELAFGKQITGVRGQQGDQQRKRSPFKSQGF